jgi:hypothetical protein
MHRPWLSPEYLQVQVLQHCTSNLLPTQEGCQLNQCLTSSSPLVMFQVLQQGHYTTMFSLKVSL